MTTQQREDLKDALDVLNALMEHSTDPCEIERLTGLREHLKQMLKTKVTGARIRPMTVEELTNDRIVTAEKKLYEEITRPEFQTLESYYERHESVRAVAQFPKEYTESPWEIKTFTYSERPGFDHCKWSVSVESINAETLKYAIKKYAHVSGTSDYPFVELSYASVPEAAVKLPWHDRTYSKIDIILSPYEHFLFQHSNLARKDKCGVSIEPKDIMLLETRVRPIEGYEELGNFRSYSADENEKVIHDSCDRLREEFGIQICKEKICAMYIELAMTPSLFNSFDDMRVIGYFQQFIDKMYKPSIHMHSVKKPYISEHHDLTLGNDKMEMECLDGLTAKCCTRGINIYDKGYETQCRLRDSHGGTILFLNDVVKNYHESYARIEFSVAKKNPLIDCFYYDESNSKRKKHDQAPLLSDLSQKRIEGAYTNMIEKYFGDTYETYAKDADDHLETIVTAINPYYNRSWKTDFQKAVFLYDQASHGLPLVLRNNDVDHLVSKNPSFAKHPGRYREILHDLLSHGNRYGYRDPYQILGEIFDKTLRLNHIKTNRTVTYAYTNDY